MARREARIGPGAASLLLVAVVVSICVLGILAMLNVQSDIRLTERSTALITSQYDASAQAEQDLARLDTAVVRAVKASGDEAAFLNALSSSLPDGMKLDGNTVSWEITIDESRALQCAVRVSNTLTADRIAWVTHVFVNTIGEEGFETFD